MLLVIFNKSAGKGKTKGVVGKLCDELHDLGVSYKKVEKADFTRKTVDNLFENGNVTRVIICGGDGTVNRTINTLYDYLQDIEIGIVPCGYGNLIAKSLDEPASLDSFLSDSYHSDLPEVKVGKANGRIFLNVVSIGSTADTVATVESFRRTPPGSVIYRALGGIFTHTIFFFLIQFKILFLYVFRDYPSSMAWMRTNSESRENPFALFTGVRETIGQYKSLYLPRTHFIPWKKDHSPVNSREYTIEHDHPFFWQTDGEPHEKTRTLRISFGSKKLKLATIQIDCK
ncbi:diacylglycerol/lipid kinase family protein [Natronogracilivirga saccharolytica]|uniref:DAGKc domain-containing protein n=1 Tax=Natronogracilivirga saccharolytica TaxID=2812953 RepID=A0A8J7RJV8_9BACT|nr:diacylglycerol kinase family protein [Natronogracilivirga saccharolytica]MBP3192577.1 hypothetical protein [Natronogracilivirga saccharolytica]